MIFNSFEFLWLFPIIFCVYWIVVLCRYSKSTPPHMVKQRHSSHSLIRALHKGGACVCTYPAVGDGGDLSWSQKD